MEAVVGEAVWNAVPIGEPGPNVDDGLGRERSKGMEWVRIDYRA
jgi:hypothetical protein